MICTIWKNVHLYSFWELNIDGIHAYKRLTEINILLCCQRSNYKEMKIKKWDNVEVVSGGS